jgi:hypothetical protein
MPQSCEFGSVDAAAHAAGVHEATVWIVIGEQQSAEQRSSAFGIGPADHEANRNLSNSTVFTTPARCQADSIMD